MYCKNCGTQIADDSVYCSKCGKPTYEIQKQESEITNNWEYTTFEKYTSTGEYLEAVTDSVYVSEASARMTIWYKHKQIILAALQSYFDDGWESISEIDPSCLIIKNSSEQAKGAIQNIASALGYSWWLVGIKIPLRRQVKGKPIETCKFRILTVNKSHDYFVATLNVPDEPIIGESFSFYNQECTRQFKKKNEMPQAYSFAINLLEKKGWHTTGKINEWQNTTFSRPKQNSSGYWETWTVAWSNKIWASNNFSKNTFLIVRPMHGIIKDGVYQYYSFGKSSQLKTSLFSSDVPETNENKSVLNGFIQELTKNGFELQPDVQSNESWYSKIFIKNVF